MRRLPSFKLLAFAVLATGAPASAHVGEHVGGFASGLAHPFLGIDHVAAMVAVGLWAALLGRKAVWLLPLTFPAVMAVGAVMGAQGNALPFVELGIAASVVVLGAAVAFGVRLPVAASAALVALFALFHGHAHGAELPTAGSALLYGAGFILATLVLHAIGIGAGLFAGRPVVMRVAGGAVAVLGVALLVM